MMFLCSKCLESKNSSEFYKDARNTNKEVASRCKECMKASQRERNKTHEYGEKDKLRARAWELANKEKSYLQRKARRLKNIVGARLSVLRWEKANPDKKYARKSRLKQAIPQWYEADKVKLIYLKANEYGLEVDHIVPIHSDIVCGLHCWANLQLLDKNLNASKGNRNWPDMPTQLTDAQLMAITV